MTWRPSIQTDTGTVKGITSIGLVLKRGFWGLRERSEAARSKTSWAYGRCVDCFASRWTTMTFSVVEVWTLLC